jgi:hypothetical protein
MIHKTKDTHKFQGIDRKKQAVYLGLSFMATLDGGKTRFRKDITYLAYFKDPKLFERFLQEVKMGETVNTVQLWEDLGDHYIVEFSRV